MKTMLLMVLTSVWCGPWARGQTPPAIPPTVAHVEDGVTPFEARCWAMPTTDGLAADVQGALRRLAQTGADADSALRAAGVLWAHGLDRAALFDSTHEAVRMVALPGQGAEALNTLIQDRGIGAPLRAAALVQLAASGEATPEAAVDLSTWDVVLTDLEPEVRKTARQVLSGFTAPFPVALLREAQGSDESSDPQSEDLTVAIVRALGLVPRLDLSPWLCTLVDQPIETRGDLELRLGAFASLRPGDQTRERARDLARGVAVMSGANAEERGPPLFSEATHAFAGLDPEVANGLVSEVHRLVTAESAVLEDMLPLLQRMSKPGDQRLLGMMGELNGADAETLAAWFDGRASDLLPERIAAGLRGDDSLPLALLRRAGPVAKGDPILIAHLEKIYRDGDAKRSEFAFSALLLAGGVRGEILEDALSLGQGTRTERSDLRNLLREIQRMGREHLGDELVVQMFEDLRPMVRATGMQIVAESKTPPPPQVEDSILASFTPMDPTAWGGDAKERRAATDVAWLVRHGSEGAVQALWKKVQDGAKDGTSDTAWLADSAVEALTRGDAVRSRPWLHETLLIWRQELAGQEGAAARNAELEVLRALAVAGDRGAGEDLYDAITEMDSRLLLRSRDALAGVLDDERALELLTLVREGKLRDSSAQVRGLQVLGARRDLNPPGLSEGLRAVFEDGAVDPEAGDSMDEVGDDVRRAALGAWLGRASSKDYLAAFSSRLGQEPLVGRFRDEAYEVVQIAATPEILPPLQGARLIAEVLLLGPLALADQEAQRDATPRPRFPLQRAGVHGLRALPLAAVSAAVGEVGRELVTTGRARWLSRARVLLTLRESAAVPELLEAIGPILAEVLLAIPDPVGQRGRGVAHLLLMDRSRDGEDWAAASLHAKIAARDLLAHGDALAQRIFLGSPDAQGGDHPWAALAAGAAHFRGCELSATAAHGGEPVPELVDVLRRAATLGAADARTMESLRALAIRSGIRRDAFPDLLR